MKKLLMMAVVLCTLGPTTLFAQELDIEWGKSFDSNTEVEKILGMKDDLMVAFSTKGKGRFISTYTKAGFAQKTVNEFELPEIENKKSGLLNIALSGDHITTILYVYIKKTKSFLLYSQAMDLNGKYIGTAQKIYQSEANDEKIKDMKVEAVFSPDHNKALIYFERANKQRTEFYSDVVVLDLTSDLKTLSSSKYDFKIRSSKSEKVDFKLYHSVENDGTFSIVQEKVEYDGLTVGDFSLKVSRYGKDGGLLASSPILKEDNKVFLSPTIIVKKDKILLVGYYLNLTNKGLAPNGYTGLFYAELGVDLSLKAVKTSRFSDEFLTNLYSKKRVEKFSAKGKELLVPSPYTMNEIIVHSDGSLTVLSEYYLVTITSSDRGSKTTTTNYGPILYFKLNSSGELTSADAIKKNQITVTRSVGIGYGFSIAIFVSVELPDKKSKYWSYASSIVDDNIYLVFNDHFKNSMDDEDELSRTMANPKKSIPYIVTIKPDGSFDKKAMISSGDTETYTVPHVVHHLSDSEFIIWGVWKKQNKFGYAKVK